MDFVIGDWSLDGQHDEVGERGTKALEGDPLPYI